MSSLDTMSSMDELFPMLSLIEGATALAFLLIIGVLTTILMVCCCRDLRHRTQWLQFFQSRLHRLFLHLNISAAFHLATLAIQLPQFITNTNLCKLISLFHQYTGSMQLFSIIVITWYWMILIHKSNRRNIPSNNSKKKKLFWRSYCLLS